MPSFWQLEAYFQGVNPGPPANSSQANWLASAAEARQLADELVKNVEILKQFWSGPAANAYYDAMRAIAEFAAALATDMTNMANGLSQMSMMASTIKPQALSIINAARHHSYTRAAAIAPLMGLLSQLSSSYTSNRGNYWKEPSQAPKQLPQAGNEKEAQPQEGREAGKVSPVDLLDGLQDLRKITEIGKYIYDAFNPDDFPSGVIGTVPGNGDLPGWPNLPDLPGPGGGDGGIPGWDGNGPLPDPDHPDYQPLPEPETELTDPNAPPETSLASAAPSGMVGPPPALSLATGAGPGMGGGMGAVPMAGMGMGMGAAGSGARSAPSSSPGGRPPGGMMGPGMMGAPMRGGQQQDEESGHHTWLTEDEMAWDGDAAPAAVVDRPTSAG